MSAVGATLALANAGLDPTELAEDDLSGLRACRRPQSEGLQVLQVHVEALAEVGNHVVIVARLAMLGTRPLPNLRRARCPGPQPAADRQGDRGRT
jgi:hypothetical protein